MKITQEHNLNFFQLACILGCALGVPAMTIGGHLAGKYGPGVAFSSVCVGNFVLWIIGLGIISMAEGRNHAIENIKSYLGRYTGFFSAILWMIVFLIWYSIQVQGASSVISSFVPDQSDWGIGVIIGVLVALLSIGSIKIIKKVCMIAFPLIVCLILYAVVISRGQVAFGFGWNFSFEAILSVIVVWLPFSVNLPTITRHSYSKADSILGISLKTMFLIFFESSTIFLNVGNPIDFVNKFLAPSSFGNIFIAVLFVVASYICVNLLNIYFAYAGWETVFPKYQGRSRYFFVGVLGTIAYYILNKANFSFGGENNLVLIETVLTSFVINLGIVLLLDFLASLIIRDRAYEKIWGTICWAVGCFTTVYQVQFSGRSSTDVYLVGSVASLICFIVIIFIREGVFSLRKVIQENR